jgi:predicted nucleic acid-binding protein
MLEMLFVDQFAIQAESVYEEWLRTSVSLTAPALFYAEVSSAIRRRVHRGLLEPANGSRMLTQALQWPIVIWEDVRLVQPSALEFATRFNRPKAYDAQYLALADLLGCELWTADRRLVNAVAGQLPWVRWIGEGA